MMLRRFRALPSPALVISCIALVLAIGGGSFALAISDSHKDRKIAKKVANRQITKRAPGLSVNHATTADNANNANTLNGKSSNSFVPYSGTIPSGTTVTGNWYAAPSEPGLNHFGFDEITLPAEAPTPIDAAHANMGAGTTNGSDNDASCTGTSGAPTAPAGTMCFYVGVQPGLNDLAGYSTNGDPAHGAAVRVQSDGTTGSHYARGSWAYTAP